MKTILTFENNIFKVIQMIFRLVSVGFWICAKMSGLLKKNRLQKPVFPDKISVKLHASTLQNFARRHFLEVNEVSFVLSRKMRAETGEQCTVRNVKVK